MKRTLWLRYWRRSAAIVARLGRQRFLPRMQRSLRKNLRRIQKQGYRYEITREPAEIKEYYERMYRPYMRNTHGTRAIIVSYEHMIRHADIGELILRGLAPTRKAATRREGAQASIAMACR